MTVAASITAPTHITSLQTTGYLVSLRVSKTTGQIVDQEASAWLADQKSAQRGAVSAHKKLFESCKTYKALSNVSQTVYNGLKEQCFRWSDDWWYLITARLPSYTEWQERMLALHASRLDDFMDDYSNIRANAAFTLGEMFNERDFPSPTTLRSRFTITPMIMDVPAGDFRVRVAHDLAEDLRRHYVRQTETIVQEMLATQQGRMVEVLQSLAHCCGLDEKVNDKGETVIVRRKLREGTFQKALEMIRSFREFNPAQSAELEMLRADMERALSGVTIDVLRESDSERARVGQEVTAILSKFKF